MKHEIKITPSFRNTLQLVAILDETLKALMRQPSLIGVRGHAAQLLAEGWKIIESDDTGYRVTEETHGALTYAVISGLLPGLAGRITEFVEWVNDKKMHAFLIDENGNPTEVTCEPE